MKRELGTRRTELHAWPMLGAIVVITTVISFRIPFAFLARASSAFPRVRPPGPRQPVNP